MDNQPVTRPSLLIGIRDPRNGWAWSQFVAIYSPLVYRFVRRRGLQDTDAADVTQDVFCAVARSIRQFEYDRQRGAFRSWLIAVTRSKLNDFIGKQTAKQNGIGGTEAWTFVDQQAASGDEEAFVENEHRRCLFDWAVGQIRGEFQPTTWQAFWRTSVEGEETRAVAHALELTVGAVYIARSRVLARLKAIIREVEE